MGFAPSTVSSCSWSEESERIRLGVAFLGLFGPNGPLPLHLTDYALERERRHRDPTFLRFADVFHHRFLCLFYRGWANAQPTVSFDRPGEDRFGGYLASLCGLGLPSLRHRDEMSDRAKLHFTGRLQCIARNPEGLEQIVSSYFRVEAAIGEFIGEWLEISPRDRCMLGRTPATGSLGVNAIVGAYAFECQHRFRLHIGPVGLADFEKFLPGGGSLPALVAVVRNYVGDELAWDLQLILRREEVPELRLGEAARLGWTSWLGTRESERDADDVILDPLRRR
jgi:type VI secretion system protein ImpH